MPDDPSIWVILIIITGLVITLALWLGRGLIFRKSKKGFSIELKEPQDERISEQRISVGKNLKIDDSEISNISGIKQENVDDHNKSKHDIEVLSDGRIKKTKVGDISGIKQENKSKGEKS